MKIRELLHKVIIAVRADRDSYYQGMWKLSFANMQAKGLEPRCGTTCCIAGHVLIQNGKDLGNKSAPLIFTQAVDTLIGPRRPTKDYYEDHSAIVDLFNGGAIERIWTERGGDSDKRPKPGSRKYVELGVAHIEQWLAAHPELAEREIYDRR